MHQLSEEIRYKESACDSFRPAAPSVDMFRRFSFPLRPLSGESIRFGAGVESSPRQSTPEQTATEIGEGCAKFEARAEKSLPALYKEFLLHRIAWPSHAGYPRK